MSAKIIDGKILAANIRADLKVEIERLGGKPGLAVILVGNNPSSQIYVRNKVKACNDLGIESFSYCLPETTSQAELELLVKTVVADGRVNGILVQLPLPKHICEADILSLIPAEKDVDGFSNYNMGNMLLGGECLLPCTPHGIIKLIESTGEDICGKNAVVIGRSNIVGKPASMLLLSKNATVTICHSKTQNLSDITKNADILVVAVGRPQFVNGNMIKPGAIVIDVGTNRVDGKLVGDVEFESASSVAEWITPVPGGVGPMTITMLMHNTVQAYKRANGVK